MKVKWLRRAERSLNQILEFVAPTNPQAAFDVLTKIRNVEHILKENPEIGRLGRIEGTREYIIPNTRFIISYRLLSDEIHILHVLHSAREWPSEL